jgi:hypothetical protein
VIFFKDGPFHSSIISRVLPLFVLLQLSFDGSPFQYTKEEKNGICVPPCQHLEAGQTIATQPMWYSDLLKDGPFQSSIINRVLPLFITAVS